LRDDIFQPQLVGVVTKALEGSYLCHCERGPKDDFIKLLKKTC
jgi:hypothetical protein